MNRKMKGQELVNYVHGDKKLIGYVNPLLGTYKTVEQVAHEKEMREQKAFDQYANVFNRLSQCLTFIGHHRPGYVAVKIGRKFVPTTREFAERMKLKVYVLKSVKVPAAQLKRRRVKHI